ncbi:MAG: hypothetical protein V4710_24390, partial [Verrucomicrobiota bacterium]
MASKEPGKVEELAHRHQVDVSLLNAWFDYLGIGWGRPVPINSYFTGKLPKAAAHDFIKGWGLPETPQILANSSDQAVRIPGHMKPHGVAV